MVLLTTVNNGAFIQDEYAHPHKETSNNAVQTKSFDLSICLASDQLETP